MSSILRIAGVQENSVVDGPGVRYVLFLQGCHHHCEGCHNPQTWPYDGGYDIATSDVVRAIVSDPIVSGVTFSGGEPFMQSHQLAPLARELKGLGYNLWSYTGYLWNQVRDDELTKYLDVVVDGPFVKELKTLNTPFRGSSNQRIIDVQRSLHSGHVIMLPMEDGDED